MATESDTVLGRTILNSTPYLSPLTIAAVSDIHGSWKEWNQEWNAELVILAGDICGSDIYSDQKKEMSEFLEELPNFFPAANKFVVVPGNHDFWIEREFLSGTKRLGPGIEILVDSGVEYEGRKIWGNPWTICGSGWAFQWSGRRREDLRKIPNGLDLLVTHDAPRFYILKCIKESLGDYGFEEPGSLELAQVVKKTKPRIHIFGHIHKPDHGVIEETEFYNVSGYPIVIKDPGNPY